MWIPTLLQACLPLKEEVDEPSKATVVAYPNTVTSHVVSSSLAMNNQKIEGGHREHQVFILINCSIPCPFTLESISPGTQRVMQRRLSAKNSVLFTTKAGFRHTFVLNPKSLVGLVISILLLFLVGAWRIKNYARRELEQERALQQKQNI